VDKFYTVSSYVQSPGRARATTLTYRRDHLTRASAEQDMARLERVHADRRRGQSGWYATCALRVTLSRR
jgi:hypothetical protein